MRCQLKTVLSEWRILRLLIIKRLLRCRVDLTKGLNVRRLKLLALKINARCVSPILKRTDYVVKPTSILFFFFR